MTTTSDEFEDGSGDPYEVRRQRVLDDARFMVEHPTSKAPGAMDVEEARRFLYLHRQGGLPRRPTHDPYAAPFCACDADACKVARAYGNGAG